MMNFLRAALIAAFAFIPVAEAAHLYPEWSITTGHWERVYSEKELGGDPTLSNDPDIFIAGLLSNRHIRSISDVSAPILPTLDLQFANGEALDAFVTFARASSATYFDSAGVLQTASSGVARVNSHVYDGANWINRGFLLEESRTNSLFPSEDLTGTWVNTNTDEPTTNNADPAGGTSAVEVAATSTADQQFAIYRSFTGLTAGHSTAISVFVSAGTNATFAQLVWDADGGGTDGAFCNFNLSTGASGSITAFAAGTATDCGVEDLGGGFYRLWIVAEIDAGTVGRLTIGIIDQIGAAGFEAADLADNDSIIPWGVQVEINKTFITSYMGETTSGTVVRAKDVATGSDVSWVNENAGTFITESFPPSSIKVGVAYYLFELDDPAKDDRIGAYTFINLNTTIFTRHTSGNTGNNAVGTGTAGVAKKAGLAYAHNDVVAIQNGTVSSPDILADLPLNDPMTDFNIGANRNGGELLNGYLRYLRYWPVRLENAYLVARTTL